MNQPDALEGRHHQHGLAPARGRSRSVVLAIAASVFLGLAACGSTSTPASTTGSSSNGSSIVATARAYLAQYYQIRTFATPATGPKAVAGKRVWFVSCGQQSPACAADMAAAVEAGNAIGWHVTICDGNFGLNDAYSTCVRQATAAKADAIALLDIECDTIKQALVEAQTAHIPVLNIQGPDCQGSTNLQNDYQYFPGYLYPKEYSYLSGQIMGYDAIVLANGAANMLYYHIIGNEGSQEVSAGLQNALSKCSGCAFKEEDVPLAQLSPALAARVQSDLLGNPAANAVAVPFASVFDVGLGPGLVRANRHIVVISASQSIAFYTSMRTDTNLVLSTLTGSELQQSWGAIDDLNRLLNGQPVVPQGGFIGLTDLSHNLPAPGQDFDPWAAQFFSTRFPYKQNYMKIWNGG